MEVAERAEHQPSETYRQKLSAGESLWPWKFGLRVILLVIAVIGIGCIAWAVKKSEQGADDYDFYEDETWSIPWGLITVRSLNYKLEGLVLTTQLSLSFIWSAICILVLLIRKRPTHPGIAVGLDLILWIALIMTALLAAVAAVGTSSFGADGSIQDYDSGDGYYYLAPNGTWVYNTTSSSSYYSPYYDNMYGEYKRDCQPAFNSCAEQDALVNQLWHERNHLAGVEWTGVACQAAAVILHFALFVWACCDTHARNSRRTRKQAEGIAEKIILDLRDRGQILPAQGTQQMRQPLLERPDQTAGTADEVGGTRRQMTPPGHEQSGRGTRPRVSGLEEESHGISPIAPATHGTVRDV